jgi:hypothetical protein
MHRCTRVEQLRITSRSVSSEILAISSRLFVWVQVLVSPQGEYFTLYFSNNPKEESQVPLGPANKEAMAHHRN